MRPFSFLIAIPLGLILGISAFLIISYKTQKTDIENKQIVAIEIVNDVIETHKIFIVNNEKVSDDVLDDLNYGWGQFQIPQWDDNVPCSYSSVDCSNISLFKQSYIHLDLLIRASKNRIFMYRTSRQLRLAFEEFQRDLVIASLSGDINSKEFANLNGLVSNLLIEENW